MMSWQWPAGRPGQSVTGTTCYPHQRQSVSVVTACEEDTHTHTLAQLGTDSSDELLLKKVIEIN